MVTHETAAVGLAGRVDARRVHAEVRLEVVEDLHRELDLEGALGWFGVD